MDLNEQDYIIDMRNIDKGYFLGMERVLVLKQINFRVKKGRVCSDPWPFRIWKNDTDEHDRLYGCL